MQNNNQWYPYPPGPLPPHGPPPHGPPPPHGVPPCYSLKTGPPIYQGGPCSPPPRPCAPVILCPEPVPPPTPCLPCVPYPPVLPLQTIPVPMNVINNPPPPCNPCIPCNKYFKPPPPPFNPDPNNNTDPNNNPDPDPHHNPHPDPLYIEPPSPFLAYPNSTCNTDYVSDTITLDIAFLSQEYSTPIEVACNNNHIVELDDINIDICTFKAIFYPYGENFGLEKNNCCNPGIYPYITFSPPYRSIHCGQPFSLLEQIIMNTETDLNVTRNCFTTCTLIDLSKEISNIKTLCDIECCSLLASLPWSNIQNIIKNDYINRVQFNPLRQMVLVISIIFKSPNTCVLPTIIKFKYRMNIDTSLF